MELEYVYIHTRNQVGNIRFRQRMKEHVLTFTVKPHLHSVGRISGFFTTIFLEPRLSHFRYIKSSTTIRNPFGDIWDRSFEELLVGAFGLTLQRWQVLSLESTQLSLRANMYPFFTRLGNINAFRCFYFRFRWHKMIFACKEDTLLQPADLSFHSTTVLQQRYFT